MPDRVKSSFVIFDIRALDAQPSIKNKISSSAIAVTGKHYCAIMVFRPVGAYGVPVQYERSFRWKLGQFRYLCSVSQQPVSV